MTSKTSNSASPDSGAPRPNVTGIFRHAPVDPIAALNAALVNRDHPFTQLERLAGITATEAAARLGVSYRQYQRYKAGRQSVPYQIRLLIDLGALTRPASSLLIDSRLQEWQRSNSQS